MFEKIYLLGQLTFDEQACVCRVSPTHCAPVEMFQILNRIHGRKLSFITSVLWHRTVTVTRTYSRPITTPTQKVAFEQTCTKIPYVAEHGP